MHTEHADRDGLNELSGLMIGCAFAVLNMLGTGFLENALKVVLADVMHQLYQSDRPTALPAARFRQAAPGDQTSARRPVNRAETICAANPANFRGLRRISAKLGITR